MSRKNISPFDAASAVSAYFSISEIDRWMNSVRFFAFEHPVGEQCQVDDLPHERILLADLAQPFVAFVAILQNVEKEYGDKLKSITKKIDAAVQEEKRFEETIDKPPSGSICPRCRCRRARSAAPCASTRTS